MRGWATECLQYRGFGVGVSVCSLQIYKKLLFCGSLKPVLPPGAGEKLQGWALSSELGTGLRAFAGRVSLGR